MVLPKERVSEMTLDEFDNLIGVLDFFQRDAGAARARATDFENRIYKSAGIQCHDRGPGFPCWTHPEFVGYCNTPRQVIEAIEKQSK